MRGAEVFRDRRDAGRRLGEHLTTLAGEHPVVVALPRGGVPVAYETALALRAPLDVLVARKLGAPGNPEFGIGAVAEDGVRVLNGPALRMLRLAPEDLEDAVGRAERELHERRARYRRGRPRLPVIGRTVILVDDGLATGTTARAALRSLRTRDAARVVLAVPVAARDTLEAIAGECDEVACLLTPDPMWAVGYWYRRFGQTSDAEVGRLLAASKAGAAPASAGGDHGGNPPAPAAARSEVTIGVAEGGHVAGDLVVPEHPLGVVIFAHGSGSSRHSPRNREVAGTLNAAGLATLLVDLLTPAEESRRANVFDIGLLAGRLAAATSWVRGRPELAALGLGYFGASTGAGAALWAAAGLGGEVGAVVSRGGRPDLAGPRLRQVRSPTLLVVGGEDRVVLELNRDALSLLECEAHLEIVPGATHLFEEPGALDHVARLAVAWFTQKLTQNTPPAAPGLSE
jgi:predicted phosphoribosyltransferase/dienelactone hydrolase